MKTASELDGIFKKKKDGLVMIVISNILQKNRILHF